MWWCDKRGEVKRDIRIKDISAPNAQTRGAALAREAIVILFLFEVIKTKPSGRAEFLGPFLVVRVSVFHARMIRLSRYFVGSRKGEGGCDCGLNEHSVD